MFCSKVNTNIYRGEENIEREHAERMARKIVAKLDRFWYLKKLIKKGKYIGHSAFLSGFT